MHLHDINSQTQDKETYYNLAEFVSDHEIELEEETGGQRASITNLSSWCICC